MRTGEPSVSSGEIDRLSLTEHLVLALVAEGPSHGFAVARELGSGEPLGQIYRVTRPLVYRALDRLLHAGLVDIDAVQTSTIGPQRTRFRITAKGKARVDAWLVSPVAHIRDIRTEFLTKVVLLDRSGADVKRLARAQRTAVAAIVRGLENQPSERGPEWVVRAWRQQNAQAALRFLDKLIDASPADKRRRLGA